MTFDLVIAGGVLLDGTGNGEWRADVGIAGDRIAALGELSAAEAGQVLDASGRIVCPGFIDAHSHSDTYILLEPSAPSKILQGITTEIVGNCGASAAPLARPELLPADWQERDYPGPWQTVAEYRALLETVRPAPNIVLLAGHNTLRKGVAGLEQRAVTPAELEAMVRLLEQAMDEGARGFSSGLIYNPGLCAGPEELGALAAAAARRGGVYTTHMRSEAAGLLKSIAETLAVTERCGVRTQISHLKVSGEANWALAEPALERIRAARAAGLPVAADRYPYTSGCTDLDIVLPDWARDGGRQAILDRLRDPDTRARMREQMTAAHSASSWGGITIGSTWRRDNARFQGRPLPEVAAALGVEPPDAVLHLLETDETHTSAFFAGMSEQNMARILAEPYVMLGTDASLRALSGPLSRDFPHPRAYGTFPRFLRMAIDGATVPLPEAVRKCTALPAAQFGLERRGRLAVGAQADVVVFDPAAVRDAATFAAPHAPPKGIDHVLVNGILTVHKGALTDARGGRFL